MNRPGPYMLARIRANAMLMVTLLMIAVPIHAQPAIVEVIDRFSSPVEDAQVVFKAPDGRELTATYSSEHKWYRFTETLVQSSATRPVDLGLVRVSHPGFEQQIVPVKVGPDANPLRVYLGVSGDEYTYMSGRRIPYTPNHHIYGVVVSRIDSNQLGRMIDTLGLSISIGGDMYIVRDATPFSRTYDERLRALRSLPGVVSAGPIVGSNTILTNRILVQFMPGIRNDACARILREEGITEHQHVMSQLYVGTADRALSHGINDLMDRLMRRPEVENVLGSAVRSSVPIDVHD